MRTFIFQTEVSFRNLLWFSCIFRNSALFLNSWNSSSTTLVKWYKVFCAFVKAKIYFEMKLQIDIKIENVHYKLLGWHRWTRLGCIDEHFIWNSIAMIAIMWRLIWCWEKISTYCMECVRLNKTFLNNKLHWISLGPQIIIMYLKQISNGLPIILIHCCTWNKPECCTPTWFIWKHQIYSRFCFY